MMQIRFLSVANREVDDAVQWYEAKEVDLSREFLDEWIESFGLLDSIHTRAGKLSRKSDGSSLHAFPNL